MVGTIITPILQTRQPGHTVASNLHWPALTAPLTSEGRSHAPQALAPTPECGKRCTPGFRASQPDLSREELARPLL